jgi:cation transport protein ChaC
MWVFGYGSLMWDDWEKDLDGSRFDGAVLHGYRRAFNKASERNWGTQKTPGPTLGLEPDADAICVGTAFQFSDDRRTAVTEFLT